LPLRGGESTLGDRPFPGRRKKVKNYWEGAMTEPQKPQKLFPGGKNKDRGCRARKRLVESTPRGTKKELDNARGFP